MTQDCKYWCALDPNEVADEHIETACAVFVAEIQWLHAQFHDKKLLTDPATRMWRRKATHARNKILEAYRGYKNRLKDLKREASKDSNRRLMFWMAKELAELKWITWEEVFVLAHEATKLTEAEGKVENAKSGTKETRTYSQSQG